MTNAKTTLHLIKPLMVILVSGCAPAYHSYSGCGINCKYCVPPPLPYSQYEDCVCHSCAASRYLAMPSAPLDSGAVPAGEAVKSDADINALGTHRFELKDY